MLPILALAAALGFVGELAFTPPDGIGSTRFERVAGIPARESAAAASWRSLDLSASAGLLSRARRNRFVGRRMLARRPWSSPRQFRCLDRLWTRESHWNHRAAQPTTGAYGIPQAYPGARMAAAGNDWRSNPRTQIKWGLRYVHGRHGNACAAWKHLRTQGWY